MSTIENFYHGLSGLRIFTTDSRVVITRTQIFTDGAMLFAILMFIFHGYTAEYGVFGFCNYKVIDNVINNLCKIKK